MAEAGTWSTHWIDWTLAAIAIALGVYHLYALHRHRRLVDRLSQHQSETIRNLHGFLLGLKAALDPKTTVSVNDRLGYITKRDEEFLRIAKGDQ